MTGEPPLKVLSDRLKRRLSTGESVYFSAGKQYLSKENPDGRWVVKVRRMERGRPARFPVKSFAKPEDAVAYAESTRPENRRASGVGQVPVKGGAKVVTVRDLYEYCRTHTWRNLSPKRRELKESRWANHLEPYWGAWTLASIRRSAAQEWITERESELTNGMGLAQFNQCRMDLIGYFKVAILMEFYEFANPFEQLSFTPERKRIRTTLESNRFAELFLVLSWLKDRRLIVGWIADMFVIGLLTGMREGEILALRSWCIDLERGTILVNRALRRKSRNLTEEGVPYGDIQPQGIWYPKGGSEDDPKPRYAPIPDQLRPTMERLAHSTHGLVFGTKEGKLKQLARFRTAFDTLRKRLTDISKGDPTSLKDVNDVINLAKSHAIALPQVWTTITFRDTRNSFASYAAEVGVPEPTRMALMGHEGSTVTFKSYTDLTSGAFSDAQERLSRGWKLRQR